MKRKLLIAAAALLGLFLLGVAALFIFIDPEDIKNQALARARETTGYSIEAGPASIKLGFSGAGVRLQEVFLQSPDTLQTVRADYVDVLVKILPLLGRKVELSSVAIGNGVYVRRGPAGTVTLHGLDLSGGFAWDSQAGVAGSLGGDVGGGSFLGEAGTLAIPPAAVKASFEMSATQDRFEFTDVEVKSGELRASLSGEYMKIEEVWEGELRGNLEPAKWKDIVSLVPPENLSAMGEAEIGGILAVPEFTLRTENGATVTTGVLTFEDLSAKHPSAPLGLSDASGTVTFSPEKVTLENGQGKLGDNPVKLSGEISGTESKFAELQVDTRIDGATLGKLMPAEAGLALEKGAVVVDLGARGPFPFESIPDLNGFIRLDELEGEYGGLPLRDTGGKINFTGKRVAIEGLHASLGRSDFVLSGQAPNIAEPWFRFALESKVLDINQLFPEEREGGDQGDTGGAAIGLPGTGTLRIGTLHVRKLTLQDVRGDARMALDGVDLTNLRGTAYGGEVSGGVNMKPTETPGTWRYEGGFDLSQVGIGEFLLAWSDLGKVVEGGLNGKLTLDGLAGAGVDARSAFNLDGDFGMKNGTLKAFPVVLSLARTLGISGVDETWPFQAIDANITVRDGKTVVKALQLKQAGFDWSIGGQVGMGGELNLDGTVRADPSRVNFLGKEIAAQYLAEMDGRIPIPFNVGGTLKSPRATIDQAALERRVAEKAKEDVNREAKKLLDGVIPDSTLKKLPLGKIFGGKGGG